MSMLCCVEEKFVEILLEWWRQNKNEFPWRFTNDPYAVLIAELLLRKTTAQQVNKIYNMFLLIFPNPESLATADIRQLEEILTPLGIQHKRAVLLKEFGIKVCERYCGQIPREVEKLLELPGVGRYAANAVLSLVYQEDVPLLDTNFIRVIHRVFGIISQKARARDDEKIWGFAQNLIPQGNSRNFNLAVLDFAMMVCKAKKPRCSTCVLGKVCLYFNNSTVRFS